MPMQVGGDPKTLHLSAQQLLSCCNEDSGFPRSSACAGGEADDVSG